MARPGDGRRIEEVRVAGWKAAYVGLIDDAVLSELVVTDERVAVWEERLAAPEPGAATLVAEQGGSVTAFAALAPARDDDVREAAELRALYVDPRLRRSGQGSALLVAGFDLMPQSLQVLWTLEGNRSARSFYEQHGFAYDGTRVLLERIPGSPPEVRYRRARLA